MVELHREGSSPAACAAGLFAQVTRFELTVQYCTPCCHPSPQVQSMLASLAATLGQHHRSFCGVVFCGMVWYGMVWCGMLWCGMVASASASLSIQVCSQDNPLKPGFQPATNLSSKKSPHKPFIYEARV